MPSPRPLDRTAASAEPVPEVSERPTGNPAHDLKNLLAVILGVCESLAERAAPGSEEAELALVGLLAAWRAGCRTRPRGRRRRTPRCWSGPKVWAAPCWSSKTIPSC